MKPSGVSYQALDEDPVEGHPVDRRVRLRVARPDLERTLARASTAIIAVLGNRSKKLWFPYERTKDELTALREAAYFDVGVSHGFTAAVADELRARRPAIEHLARRLLDHALSAHMPRRDATAAVVMTAWSLLGGTLARQPTRRRRRRTR